MTGSHVRRTNDQLLQTAERLVREYDDLAAGSVLRCYARSLRRRTRTGCPPERLAESAERLTRELLDWRRRTALATG